MTQLQLNTHAAHTTTYVHHFSELCVLLLFPCTLQVAAVFGLPVQQLLQDNLRVIRSPEQLLGGLTLTLCGIQLVKVKPKPRLPVVASQVEALLAIRSMIDKNGVLASSWSLQNANRYSGGLSICVCVCVQLLLCGAAQAAARAALMQTVACNCASCAVSLL